MSEKINIKEFIDGYEKSKNKQVYLKKIEINNYIPYGQKTFLANKIVESSSYDKDGYVTINSPSRYIIFIYTLLNSYTNLNMHSESMLDDFDLLNKYGLIDEIVALIPEKEVDEFNKILGMVLDDFMTNHYEIHGYIQDIIKKISNVVDGTSPQLLEELKKFLGNNGDGE